MKAYNQSLKNALKASRATTLTDDEIVTTLAVDYPDILVNIVENSPTGDIALTARMVDDAILAGRKIEAIKLLRSQTNFGLREAKIKVEDRTAELQNWRLNPS